MHNLNRKLAPIILSKCGGNVDHTLKTVIEELIDNCLDNDADIIHIDTITDSDSDSDSDSDTNTTMNKYLIIYDNGTGIENIDDIFLATKGKINKKGSKNQGFLDSLAYLSNIDGVLNIYTNFNSSYSRLCVDFSPMKKEYNKQLKEEYIDYNKCQEMLELNYQKYNHRSVLELNSNNILEKIKNGGTYIKIPLYKEFDFIYNEIENTKPFGIHHEYFQYRYNQNFNLNYLEKDIKINNIDDICINSKYTAAICTMYMASHSNGNKIYKFNNNFNKSEIYYKKTSKHNTINNDEYNKLLSTYYEETKIASIKFVLISSDDAKEQQSKINTGSIDDMRQLFISYQNKILGPFKFPKAIGGVFARNLLDMRIILEINDDTLIKEIIMTNKSHTNMNSLDQSIIKFIKYCKTYFGITYNTHIGKKFKEIKDSNNPTPGILNMINYLQNEETKEALKKKQKEEEEEAALKKQKEEAVALKKQKEEAAALKKQKEEEAVALKKQKEEEAATLKKQKEEEIINKGVKELQKKIPESEQQKKKEVKKQQKEQKEPFIEKRHTSQNDYQPWKFAVYFGILECNRDNGIYTKDNYYKCHFGITRDDPKHRDSGSGLGTNWRRLIYNVVNNDGQQPSEGKYVIEWKLHDAIKTIETDNNIIWETKEYFKCPKDKFHIIYNKIRNVIGKYDGLWY